MTNEESRELKELSIDLIEENSGLKNLVRNLYHLLTLAENIRSEDQGIHYRQKKRELYLDATFQKQLLKE